MSPVDYSKATGFASIPEGMLRRLCTALKLNKIIAKGRSARKELRSHLIKGTMDVDDLVVDELADAEIETSRPETGADPG